VPTAILDTNVILDAIAAREPFKKDADAIFAFLGENKLTAYVTASSVTDIYYILHRKLPDEICRKALRNLFNLMSVVTVSQKDCEAALSSPVADFEDALVSACALKSSVDYIITRDEDFLKTPGTISPVDFVKLHSL
jgi:putative PIN family toxin of toxin-antitoxin system